MRSSKLVSLIGTFALALSATPGLVYAHGGGACRQDVQQLCPDITPGPGAHQAYRQCLTNNAANLSDACKEQLARRQARKQEVLQACAADIQTLCSDAEADPHAIFKCLHENRDNLSQTCRDQLPHHRHHHHHCDPTPTPAS